MPVYDFRCNSCGRRLTLTYPSYSAYDRAAAEGHLCPHCGSRDLTRLISRVTIAKPVRDYANLSSGEMLNVLEGGDRTEVDTMMRQLGQDQALDDPATRDAITRDSGDGGE